MFIKNKYTKWYFSLIENAKNRILNENEYYEKHHIIPKSIGGTNEKQNLILLTAREHFVCHLLLLKMVELLSQKRSMAYAIFSMGISHNGKRKKIISSREFELARKIAKEYVSGENNNFYGKGYLLSGNKNPMYKKPCYYNMSKSKKQQWKNNISKGVMGEKNPFYGKFHSKEVKKMLSEQKSIPIKVTFKDGTVVEFSQYKYLGTYLGKSEHLGCKLCKENFFYLHEKYGIKTIEKIKGLYL
jgi:hypothetical protein